MKTCCPECLVPEHDSTGEDYRGAIPDFCRDEGCVCHWSSEYKTAYLAALEFVEGILPQPELLKDVDDSNSGDVSDRGFSEGRNSYRKHIMALLAKERAEILNWSWECGKCRQEKDGLGELLPKHSPRCSKRESDSTAV